MADAKNKVAGNAPGLYFVDNTCIGCNACCSEAPDFFKMNDNLGLAYVAMQPQNSADQKLCENAKSACPVEAIGLDG